MSLEAGMEPHHPNSITRMKISRPKVRKWTKTTYPVFFSFFSEVTLKPVFLRPKACRKAGLRTSESRSFYAIPSRGWSELSPPVLPWLVLSCLVLSCLEETSTSFFPNIIKFKSKNEFEKPGENKNYIFQKQTALPQLGGLAACFYT